MTSGSSISSVYASIFFTTVIFALTGTSGQPSAHPTNLLLFKRQPDQIPLRQAYFHGASNEIPRFDGAVPQVQQVQQVPQVQQVQHAAHFADDLQPKYRGTIHVDELPMITGTPHLRPVEAPANSNQRTLYYPVQFGAPGSHHKDIACTDSHTAKMVALSNALMRAPKPDTTMRSSADLLTSASQVHQEVCPPPTTPPSVTSAPYTTSPYQSQNEISCAPTTPSPRAHQPTSTYATPPACDVPKPVQIMLTSPKITSPKNIFPPDPKCPYEGRPEEPLFTQTSFIPVSPLHPASKHVYPESLEPCTPTEPRNTPQNGEACVTKTPCFTKGSDHNYGGNQAVRVVPAEKQVVVYNPFSLENSDAQVSPPKNPKYVLHHRQHSKDCPECYPEAYASRKPEAPAKTSVQQLPYAMNFQGLYPFFRGTVPGQKPMYPFVPPPITKPIPLVIPPQPEYDPSEDDTTIGCQETKCPGCERCALNPDHRYEDDHHDEKPWSRDILRDIADRLGCQYDEDENVRFSRRRRPHDDQDDYDNRRRGQDRYPSRKASKTHWENYDDEDDDRWRNWRSSQQGRFEGH